MIKLLQGDCRDILPMLPDRSVQCCVTSPPYFGLRRYDVEGEQIGMEPTPTGYVAALVGVFRDVKRVLRDDGTLWLNLGDSYAGYWGDKNAKAEGRALASDTNGWTNGFSQNSRPNFRAAFDGTGIKPKDLIGIPWRVAFALQDDGWILRSDIIWHKPNPMPESVADRPTRSHEYLFLFAKQARYYYDAEAIAEATTPGDGGFQRRAAKGLTVHHDQGYGGNGQTGIAKGRGGFVASGPTRNRRTVWTVATRPYSGARAVADYVGADGKPYIASADCPIHSHLAKKRTGQTQQYDAPQGQAMSRSADTHPDRAQWPGVESFANLPRANDDPARLSEDDPQEYSSLMRTTENTHDYKTSEQHQSEDDANAQTHDHTTNSYSQHAHPADTTDYSSRASHETANDHSNGSRKTARAAATNQPCIASDQTADDTQHTPASPATDAPSPRTSANNSAADYGQYDLFAGMDFGSFDTQNQPQKPPLVIVRNGSTKHYTCTCEVSQVDHFATFPEALVEPCILAGSAAQACEHCGAPWERHIEKKTNTLPVEERTGRQSHNGTPPQQSGWFWQPPEITDLGFHPTCTCPGNTGAARSIVLDPFGGSGTTARVAERLQRDSILIDLGYQDLQERRTDGIQVMMVDLF